MALLTGIYLGMLVLIGISHSAIAQNQPVIRATAVVDPPYLIHEKVENGTKLTGFIPDLLAALESNAGLQFKLQLPKDGRYGSQDPDGSWSGMMGELTQDEADMAMFLTQTVDRLEAVDFTQPVITVEPTILMKKPEVVFSWREKLSRLLVPVDFSVWLLLVLAFVVTSIILYIASSVNPYEWRALGKRNEATLREVESFTCLNTFWFVITTLFWQGFVRAPRSIGGRIITAAWFFFVMIFILAYTGSLINYLQVGPEASLAVGYSTIDSFRDLSEKDDVIVGMLPSGATQNFFKNAEPDSVAGKIYKNARDFMQDTVIMSNMQGVALLTDRPVRHKSFVYIMESASARYLVSKRCDLYLVTDTLAHRYLAVGVQKGSPLLQTVNSAILELQETGEIKAIEAKWFRKSMCLQQQPVDKAVFTVQNFYPIEMETISGAILLLVAGLVLGCFMTVIEWCVNKKYQSRDGAANEENVPGESNPNMGNNVTPEDSLPAYGVDDVDGPKTEPTENGVTAASTQV